VQKKRWGVSYSTTKEQQSSQEKGGSLTNYPSGEGTFGRSGQLRSLFLSGIEGGERGLKPRVSRIYCIFLVFWI